MSRTALAVMLAVLVPPARGQTSYPMLGRVEPTAVRRGTTAEVAISGTFGIGASRQVLCEGPGLSGEVLGAEKTAAGGRGGRRGTETAKVRLTVAPDAPLGPREIRVASPKGVSSVGLVVVVADPVVAEADDKANDAADRAQEIALPGVVAGTIGKAEDVDWYAVRATAGRRLTFLVWANRLENKIHDLQVHFDPIVSLYDEKGASWRSTTTASSPTPGSPSRSRRPARIASRSATRPTRATRTGPTCSRRPTVRSRPRCRRWPSTPARGPPSTRRATTSTPDKRSRSTCPPTRRSARGWPRSPRRRVRRCPSRWS